MSDKFTVGQTVIVTEHYGRKKSATALVVKVGREYVYTATTLEGRRTRKFQMDIGEERLGSGSTGGAIYTEQEWADRNFRSALIDLLAEQGVRVDPWHVRGRHLTNDQLEQMAAAVADPARIRAIRNQEEA